MYYSYGGRGISVCDEWRNDFRKFFLDMGKCPKGMSIDRKDNDKGYNKENCRWATPSQQQRNKTNTKWIEFNGKKMCLADWGDEFSINPDVIGSRLKKGWPIKEAITLPLGWRYRLVSEPDRVAA